MPKRKLAANLSDGIISDEDVDQLHLGHGLLVETFIRLIRLVSRPTLNQSASKETLFSRHPRPDCQASVSPPNSYPE